MTADYLLQASDFDKLTLKTSVLEKQQQEIFQTHVNQKNKQFLLGSSIVSLLGLLIYFLILKMLFHVLPPGSMNFLLYIGILIIVVKTIVINYLFRTKEERRREKNSATE